MKSTFTKAVSLLLALVMVLSFAACGNDTPVDQPDNGDAPVAAEAASYTYKSYTTAFGTNWNPHSWETSADDSINSYITSPFCTMSILDSENGVYQWVWEMATGIEDVTAEHQDDLVKYNVTLMEGQTPETTTEGHVFEIRLNPNAKWQNGEAITADDYIYSMEQLLNPEMRNYRANLYYSGESAVAGGYNYYNSGAPLYADMVPDYSDAGDYSYDLEAGIAAGEVYINVDSAEITLYSMSLAELQSGYGVGSADDVAALRGEANAFGYTQLTAENSETAYRLVSDLLINLFGITDETDIANYYKEALFVYAGEGEVYGFETVGLYKVDDYTIRYVTQTRQDYNYFLTSCTSTWLVYEELYEAGKDTSGTLVTTDYCTSLETTMGYGPYMIESLQDGKQIVYVQNPNWYGYEEQEDGSLLSITPFEVDGQQVQQYKTTRIVIDVMDEAAAKQAFLKGELSDWAPSADDLLTYSASDVLYKVDETYTMSFFFNTNVDALKEMDNSKGNTNSVVLSSENFRKAMSLAIDRAEYVTATSGYKPAFALMNNLYFYDVYNDPTSSYRNSDEAKQAIVNLYGVEYGEGKAYATLDEAHDSINGYNLTEAKALMAAACQELVDAGLYTAGEDIYVRIGWAKGAIETEALNCVELLNKYINAALEGSGFGKITFEAVGNINDRYGDVPKGEFAIGYGAWGGAAFYPFRNMQVYCDTDQYSINEAGCWNPANETLTLTVNGEEVTMTWKEWSGALIGSGAFAAEDNKVKLAVTAQMEEAFLKKYYRIPLCGTTVCSMLAYQCSYYTDEYNIMYDFGGLRLMQYNFTDAEWAAYIAEQGGTISYE
ncbi:MAG: hypothetical protein IKU42_08120 [Oscillospiraceae bacterium]|nr:hypothetical protein [Oscillospiraceae bacterium]